MNQFVDRCPRGMVIDDAIADRADFFHMDPVSATTLMQTDPDVQFKPAAGGLCRLLPPELETESRV